ncbi:hypothetical protein BGW80DRAFT_1282795 [Lactifluus volemus]|nr:hypothetical protein BGW80DRAFT_1282795 [Lactifluus volemus]
MPISEDEIEAATRKLDAIRQVVSRRQLPISTHVCLAMTDNETQRVSIVREFDMGETTFKTDSGPKTFYGTMIISSVWQASPTMALRCATANNIPATAIIIGTEKDGLQDAVPRAAISAASFCNRYDLSTVRGCITSGEQWLFFHYCSDLQNLALVMGLLKDMVQNPFDPNTKFFDRHSPCLLF